MDNNNDLTAKVSGWLRQYGLCPGEQGGNGWTEVYYDGVLFEYDVMDDKVCFTVSAQIPDGDMEDRAKAAFELMENSESVQIYLEGKEDDSDGDSIILRVWVHELSDYGRFVQEFRFKMDQCVACYLKICGMPVFNGETEGEEGVADSDVQDEGLKERMRQIEAYLKDNEVEYEVVDENSIVVPTEDYQVIIDVSGGRVSLCTKMCFEKAERDTLAKAVFRVMDDTVGKWIVQDGEDCTEVLYYVGASYREDDDVQDFIDILTGIISTFLDAMDDFSSSLPLHSEMDENCSERTDEKADGADAETGMEECGFKDRILSVLKDAGYHPVIDGGVYFNWQNITIHVRYSDSWMTMGFGLYLSKEIVDYDSLSSYLFETMMRQGRVRVRVAEDESGSESRAVVLDTALYKTELDGINIALHLSDLMDVYRSLLARYEIDDTDIEKNVTTCDEVFNCLIQGGYSPEAMGEEDNVAGLSCIEYGGYEYWVFISPSIEYCRITSLMGNQTGYEFGKEVQAAFSLMSHNTDVTVSHSEPDGDECEIFYLSETFMLSDDKEKFLSDFKSYLEDLERCADFFIEQVKQQ